MRNRKRATCESEATRGAAEAERAKKLQGEIGIKRGKREQATIDKATAIAVPEARKAFVQDQIKLSKTELSGATGNVATSQQQLENANCNILKVASDKLGFNTDVDIARQNLAEAEAKFRSIKDHIATLEGLLSDASETAPDVPTSGGETALSAPGGIGARLGIIDPSAWEKAANQLKAEFAAKLGAAGNLGNLGTSTLSSDGTFSNQAGSILGGGDGQQVELLEAIQRGIDRVAVNTDDEA